MSEKSSSGPAAPRLVTKTVVVTGPIEHLFSESQRDKCVCCPDGRHRFGVRVKIPKGAYSEYEHLNDVAGGFHNICAQHGMIGRRVRVTFEVLDD